ncbi:hypothetical protein [Devosia submarina]|uniref:hypothetical protein n=1 Tax=Devosia submarina TaxID=1173082 RepID=UPI000D33D2C2|nr:hypothetical protein [Devosia submarina]
MIKAILIKPLDGQPEGTEREFDKHDFERLKALGAVREASGDTSAKAAPEAQNKMAPAVENKAVETAGNKDIVAATSPAAKKKG